MGHGKFFSKKLIWVIISYYAALDVRDYFILWKVFFGSLQEDMEEDPVS